jgi:hypothetical protein
MLRSSGRRWRQDRAQVKRWWIMSTLFPGKEEDTGPTLEAAGGRVTLQVGRCFVLTIISAPSLVQHYILIDVVIFAKIAQ